MSTVKKGGLILLVIFLVFGFFPGAGVSAAGIKPVSLASRIGREMLPTTVDGWEAWYLQDKEYLEVTSTFVYKNEINLLVRTLQKMEKQPDYRDESGFTVYSPQKTGQMHLLSAAIAARQNNGEVYPFDRLLDHVLTAERPSQYPDLNRVVRALKGLQMPKTAFEGFHIYLLPYSMGEANGYGGNGYAFLAATPDGEMLIPNQLEVTLIHEFGHYLSFRYMNRNTSEGLRLWKDYMKLRGITWHNPGDAGSKAWAASSEEVFAEDFRVWVGTPVVGSGYFGDLAYPEPNRVQGRSLKKFFEALPERSGVKLEDPWLSNREGLMNVSLSDQPWLVGITGLIGLAATVFVTKKAASSAARFPDR